MEGRALEKNGAAVFSGVAEGGFGDGIDIDGTGANIFALEGTGVHGLLDLELGDVFGDFLGEGFQRRKFVLLGGATGGGSIE